MTQTKRSTDGMYNPWHGCRKYSEGCLNCYVYRRDESVGRDASIVCKTAQYDLLTKKKRSGEYKIPPHSHIYCCMTSDFFLEEADGFRPGVWAMIRERSDVEFTIITKRVVRFSDCIPDDWGDGYDNVRICSTVESQRQAELRMPVFVALPIKRKSIICEPLLTAVDLSPWLECGIESVVVGGESGDNARLCDYANVLDIRRQCVEARVSFHFKQTGANFKKDGRVYRIPRQLQQPQARRAGIDLNFDP